MHGQKILLSLPLLVTKIKVDITLFRNHALSRNKGEKGANFQFDLYEVMTRKGGKICCVGSARCSLCENVSKKREDRIFFPKIPRTISRHILGNGLD